MTAVTIAKSAGSSRRARRPQNAAEADGPVVLVLLEQERGDEEARQHEEQVDAEVPAPRPGEVEVVREDREDRERPQSVERGEPPPPDGPARHRARAAASAAGDPSAELHDDEHALSRRRASGGGRA